MKQRLLLDRIDLRRNNAVPDPREQLTAVIHSNSANSSMVWRNLAVMGTECASDKLIRETFIIQSGLEICWHERHGSLQE